MSLYNAKIFIVGGSSGIRLGTAHLALAKGAQVIIASSSAQRLEQAKAAPGGNVKTVVLNMLHPSEVKQFFEVYTETIDHLDT